MQDSIKLQTAVKIPAPEKLFNSGDVICGIGSCFAQKILERLFACGINGEQNPTGIIYNAHSINEAVKRAVSGVPYRLEEFFDFNGKWHSWEHHGDFSSPELQTSVDCANSAMLKFKHALSVSAMFIITPSSSVVYEYISENRIVANCHKVPNNKFNVRCLSVEENYDCLSQTIEAVKSLNPSCMIVISVSPVRHYPGNLILNSRSKANLSAAVHRLLEEDPSIYYFPAYEIVLDELRDYRFFKDDMLHPNALTEKIIFRRFIEAVFTPEGIMKIEEAEKRLAAAVHRPNF